MKEKKARSSLGMFTYPEKESAVFVIQQKIK